MDIYVLMLPLLIGWILDKLLGDPVGLPHPVVGFGKLISFCEKRWNCGAHRMLKGGVAAIIRRAAADSGEFGQLLHHVGQ